MLARAVILSSLTLALPVFADEAHPADASPTSDAPPVVVAPELVIDAPPPLRTGPPPAVVHSVIAAPAAGELVVPGAPPMERLTVEVFGRRQFVNDANFALFSDKDSQGFAGLALRAPVYHAGPWAFSAEISTEGRESLGGDARGGRVWLDVGRSMVRGEAAYGLLPVLSAFAATGVGGESADFRYVNAMLEQASSKTWSLAGDASLGLDVHTHLGPVIVGARLEGGYFAARAHALSVTLADVGDVAREPIDFGTLKMSGAFSRFALRLGF